MKKLLITVMGLGIILQGTAAFAQDTQNDETSTKPCPMKDKKECAEKWHKRHQEHHQMMMDHAQMLIDVGTRMKEHGDKMMEHAEGHMKGCPKAHGDDQNSETETE